jgi:predicted  nucleic acid-binding Zn-ribbon protein
LTNELDEKMSDLEELYCHTSEDVVNCQQEIEKCKNMISNLVVAFNEMAMAVYEMENRLRDVETIQEATLSKSSKSLPLMKFGVKDSSDDNDWN